MVEQKEKLANQAPCEHYGACGGCNLQHMPDKAYYDLKQSSIASITKRLGCLDTNMHDIIKIKTHQRRRAEFKITTNKKQISLGFCEARSNRIIDIKMCLVVEQKIFDLAQKFKGFLHDLKKPGNIDGINISNLGEEFDVFLLTKLALKQNDKDKIIEFAQKNSISRMTEKNEADGMKIIHQIKTPEIEFADVKIELPAGAFLQATQAGQDAITSFILEHSAASKNVVDLYSGCGTYGFPLVKNGKNVTAYEGDYDMVFALNAAARKSSLDKSLAAQARDLYKKPLRADELNAFDTAIVNPPRNGALPQVQQLTKSNVTNIIMVSCNPQSFERDAKILLEAGFVMENIMPIDQFLWSNHLELVANFRK